MVLRGIVEDAKCECCAKDVNDMYDAVVGAEIRCMRCQMRFEPEHQ